MVGAGFVTVKAADPAAAMSDARIAALTCVLLTKVVALFAPLNCKTAPFRKPAPFTVRVKAAEPAVTLDGESELIVGDALLIVNEAAFEVPAPGFVTVTLVTPAAAISAVVIAVDNCVELMKVVFFTTPLNFTTDPDAKPEPFTTNVNAGPPAVALDGESDVIEKLELLMAN